MVGKDLFRRYVWIAVSVVLGGGACKGVIDADGYAIDPALGETPWTPDAAPKCGDEVAPPEQLVRSCMLLVSCAVHPPGWARTISSCITSSLPRAYGMECVLGATDCSAVWDCLGEGPVGALCDGDDANRCEGDTLVACKPPSGEPFWQDCAKVGGDCAKSAYVAGCLVVDPCDDADEAPHCDGDKLYECNEGGWGIGRDCSLSGSICEEGAGACRFAGEGSCTEPVDECEGEVRRLCLDGRLYAYDCAFSGLACGHDGVSAACVASGCVPDDLERCEESCGENGLMNVCVGGAPYQIRCKDHGFNACKTRTPGNAVYCAM